MSQLFSHFWQLVCATLSTIVQHGSHVCSTCVCPLVGGEVIRAGEDLAAHSAAVGLVAGVEPHVPRQHVGPRERPLAHLTRGQLASLQLSYNTALVTSQRYALEFELLLSVDRD